ncbi:MAG TPA: hypothetical protein PL105_05445, partial [Caldilineaceae bacterium]|nr:hypothetical protein [Caldilineaceae bacterium]
MKPDDSILENPETQIEYWLSLRQIPRSQIEEQFDIDPETVIRTSYSWEAELELLRNRTTHTGQFYFRDHTFILYTITSSSELRKISGTQLIRALGEPTAILPSRVEKRFKVY